MENASGPGVQLRERLSKDPSAIFVEYMSVPKIRKELDLAFEPQMQIHLAHCLMLMRQEIIPAQDGAAIMSALLELHERGPASISLDYTLEDLYSHIERHLVPELGPDVAGRLHTARSRNDLRATTWRMVLRQRLLQVRESMLHLRSVALHLAGTYADAVMPGYTHS